MNIWHDTDDAPRRPRRVSPMQRAELTIGTWPIEPGQSVWVTWEAGSANGDRSQGTANATWRHNTRGNSYWTVSLGPFDEGDEVTHTVHAAAADKPLRTVSTDAFRVRIKPALYVAWLWHQHQPLYRDPTIVGPAGSYVSPWVRLHAIRDYYSMPALAAAHDAHVTFNLTPVLLRQIDDYVQNGATDRALELTRTRAEKLTRAGAAEMFATFFDADWHHQIFVHPRYRALFEQRTTGDRFSAQDLRDLQMWFNLAWFGHEFRVGDVTLITGETVRVHRFVARQEGFSHDDVLSMVEEQFKIMRAIVPLHRALQDAGRIEVATTPAFHPILPLLIDTDHAYIDRPGSALPARFAHPEDASAQTILAIDDYAHRFGRPPSGMWPAEGAVSAEAIDLFVRHRIAWVATDAGVLARSGRWGYRASEPEVLCQPYRTSDDAAPLAVFFRDTELSDGIGFRYGAFNDARQAADDFVRAIETRILERLGADDDRVLTIVLDGENAWGSYADDGRPFLHALYSRLTADPRLEMVTFSEYLCGHAARHIAPHPPDRLARVHDIATGSWIDEPGSDRGVDLGTWIGEPEENVAWDLLGASADAVVASAASDPLALARAREALYAAEGSDWFWWFGSDQDSGNDADFDDLFRAHLRGVYQALGAAPPDALANVIVARPIVWTFTAPVARVCPGDQVMIRTNCPGRLTYRLDRGPEQSVALVPVGGVMAGTSRFQITLGPFCEDSASLTFRFTCEHPGCDRVSACCLGEVHEITLARPAARRSASRRG